MSAGALHPTARLAVAASVFIVGASLGHAGAAVWVTGAIALAVAVWAPGRTRPDDDLALHDRALQRHLARCRRRDEHAHLLWVHGAGARALQEQLRVADAVMVRPGAKADELIVLVEGDTDRPAVEARLAQHADEALQTGWAAFPHDGVLLEELLDVARAAAGEPGPVPSTALRPLPACAQQAA